jgi:hypothetical protein
MISRMNSALLLFSAGCSALTAAAGCGSTPKTLSVQASDVVSTTTPQSFPQIEGMVIISDGSGPVGYIPEGKVHPRTPEAVYAQNARTLIPVTLGDGTLVGYIAQGVPFIPLAEAKRPGFDVEDVRAQLQGGCEAQIGDPTFKQKYPLCPPPPPYEPPPGPSITTAIRG